LVTVADAAGIARQFRPVSASKSVGALMAQAVLAQYDGDIGAAITLLYRALHNASDHEIGYIVELLTPILLASNRIEEAQSVLQRGRDLPLDLQSGKLAMTAAVHAFMGDERLAQEASDAARAGHPLTSSLMTARVFQRLAYVEYRLRRAEAAVDDALRSALLFERLGAYRSAAASYSVAYNVHFAVTGDIESAYEMASKMVVLARRSGDSSIEAAGTVAQYEIAAEMHDVDALSGHRTFLWTHPLPKQYGERFARGVADALSLGWSRDFTAMHAHTIILRTEVASSRAEKAFCGALQALAEAVVGERTSAAKHARNAIALSALGESSEVAYERRYRMLARGIAACVLVLVGDVVRARRAIAVRALDGHEEIRMLMRVAAGEASALIPKRIRGYAVAIECAREANRGSSFSPFTSSEKLILTMLAQGLTAPEIAQQLGRSVHTVRKHTRAIVEKMRVSGRVAAIHAARKQGHLI
jgi:DNA-binding CsgD family transcriptional regulator